MDTNTPVAFDNVYQTSVSKTTKTDSVDARACAHEQMCCTVILRTHYFNAIMHGIRGHAISLACVRKLHTCKTKESSQLR